MNHLNKLSRIEINKTLSMKDLIDRLEKDDPLRKTILKHENIMQISQELDNRNNLIDELEMGNLQLTNKLRQREEQLINQTQKCDEEKVCLVSELNQVKKIKDQQSEILTQFEDDLKRLKGENSRLWSYLAKLTEQSEENKCIIANLKGQLQILKSDNSIKDQDQQRRKQSKSLLTNNQEYTSVVVNNLPDLVYSLAAVYYTLVLLDYLK